MEDHKPIEMTRDQPTEKTAFRGFAAKRIMVGVLLTVVGLWVFGTVIGFFSPSPEKHATTADKQNRVTAGEPGQTDLPAPKTKAPASGPAKATHHAPPPAAHDTAQQAYAQLDRTAAAHTPGIPLASNSTGHGTLPQALPAPETVHKTMRTEAPRVAPLPRARGEAFVAAAVKPMEYELKERFYGWRPNDILDFTDNVNSFQLGVLEVTRRTVVNLTERISRTGSTDSFDPNLENAMNWFMIKATRYWFPSPESKYEAGLDELRKYLRKLKIGQATFHTRPDNLIPLLSAYEDLLGSCDENLVKMQEEDGSPVSFFKADDYFFYAKGIASAMLTLMEAVEEEFYATVETRRGVELLHHAIESLHHATEIDPWLITNANLSGVLANHRANMAAPISHARFYIGALIKTLST